MVTKKGQGYKLAEADPILYHGPGKFNPAEGIKPPATPAKLSYTQVFDRRRLKYSPLKSAVTTIKAGQLSWSDGTRFSNTTGSAFIRAATS